MDEASEQIEKNDEFVKQALKRVDQARMRMRKAAGLPPDEEDTHL